MHIYRAGVVTESPTPDMVEQLLTRAYMIGVRRKVVKQAVLQACQMDGVPISAYAPLLAIDGDTIG